MECTKIIRDCFQHMQAHLRETKPRGVLLNGNVELFLKAVFASGLDHKDGWSYVMDKKFNRQQVDLLLLEKGIPRISIEFKSTLFSDPNRIKKDAVKASKQAQKNDELRDWNNGKFGGCTSYIVHFLNEPYPKDELPRFICKKFHRNKRMTTEELCTFYSEKSGKRVASVQLLKGGDGLKGVIVEAVFLKI